MAELAVLTAPVPLSLVVSRAASRLIPSTHRGATRRNRGIRVDGDRRLPGMGPYRLVMECPPERAPELQVARRCVGHPHAVLRLAARRPGHRAAHQGATGCTVVMPTVAAMVSRSPMLMAEHRGLHAFSTRPGCYTRCITSRRC